MANLNEKILLAHQVNGRWVVDEDTWKGNLPAPNYQIVTPQQAQQRLQENVGTLQSEINFYTGQHGASAGTVTRRQGELAGIQQQIQKFANYTPPATSGLQYTTDPRTGNLITKENLAGFVAPNAVTPQLTQAQLTAQNTALGRTQFNTAPMQITLGNGQVVSVDKNGNFSDLQGNPITGTQVAASKAGTPITSASMQGTIPITPIQSTYNPTGVSSIMNGLTASQAQQQAQLATTQATPKEKEQSDLIKTLQDLTNEEAGRPAFQTQQETAFGADEKTRTLNDLQVQLQQILNEHTAAQLATQQGQGVTTTIDSRQRAEETRVSAIKALSISSLIAAAESNLSYAQSQANRAVETKYAPIEAKIKAATANLQLIKNDPTTTNQEKRQADQQLAIQSQMKAAVDQAKDWADKIQRIAIEAASKGADALTLQKIQNSSNPIDAARLAAPFTNPPKASGGGTTSGGFTYTKQDQSEDSQALEKSRGADGYVDPTIYQKLYTAWVNAGGLLKDFLTKFPPKNYVNPANTWLPSYLMPAGSSSSSDAFDNL